MKKSKRRIPVVISIIAVVLVGLLLLLWIGGVEGLQDIYLWIARFENSMRGIDGITEASRVKVMDDAARHYKVIVSIGRILVICVVLFVCIADLRKIDRKNRKKES